VFPSGLISSPAFANVTCGNGEPTNGTDILRSSPARTTISFGLKVLKPTACGATSGGRA
jgi:hypothetical protein